MSEKIIFNELSVSERIAVVAARNRKTKSRDRVGREYGMTGRNITRYIRCEHLIPEFKDMLDDGTITLTTGVELSYLSEGEQKAVLGVLEQNCIHLKADDAKRLRAAAGTVTAAKVQTLLEVDKPMTTTAKSPVSVKIPAAVYRKYFTDVAAKDVQGIVEAALDRYFEGKGA